MRPRAVSMLGMATMMAERRGFASGIGTPSVRPMSSLTLNGEPIRYDLDGDMPLLFALREASNLTGTKYGCDDGSCHACTVIIDGKAERSCQWRLRELEGAVVTTIEGLPANGHAVQRAWEAEMVSLCGYCEPGLIMAAVALLETNGDPSDEDLASPAWNELVYEVYAELQGEDLVPVTSLDQLAAAGRRHVILCSAASLCFDIRPMILMKK